MNLDVLQKVLELMQKYGVEELQDSGEFCIKMKAASPKELVPVSYGTPIGATKPMPDGTRIIESTDEDILMNPYHGLDGEKVQ